MIPAIRRAPSPWAHAMAPRATARFRFPPSSLPLLSGDGALYLRPARRRDAAAGGSGRPRRGPGLARGGSAGRPAAGGAGLGAAPGALGGRAPRGGSRRPRGRPGTGCRAGQGVLHRHGRGPRSAVGGAGRDRQPAPADDVRTGAGDGARGRPRGGGPGGGGAGRGCFPLCRRLPALGPAARGRLPRPAEPAAAVDAAAPAVAAAAADGQPGECSRGLSRGRPAAPWRRRPR